MSNRSLIEINHDVDMTSMPDFLKALAQYRCSACQETRKDLERFGVRVISMRHHADKFYVKTGTDGFPVKEYTDLSA